MNKEKLVLSIDFGTQSVRAAIINDKGDIKALIKNKYDQPYFTVEPGFAEQDPNYYWEQMINATKKLKEKYPALLKKIIAYSVTTFRDSPVFLDENYKPVRPMVLWLDQRQATLKKKIPFLRVLAFKIVGMYETVILNKKRTPALWVQENEPEIWAKTRYYVNFSTYIMYRLTGELIDSVANQTGHFPIYFKKGRWYGERALKNIFGVTNEKLCKIVKQGTVLGIMSPSISEQTGIPVGVKLYATGTDKASEALGTGCLTRDEASISYGTASTISVANKRYIEPETFLPAYNTLIPGLYHMEVQIYRGYWTVGWFIKEFGGDETLEAKIEALATEEVLNEKMLAVPPGAEGLVLQPYWGPGLKRPEAKGSIIGFSDFHTKIHIYRAIIEGIAFGLKEGLQSIEKKQRHKIKEIRVSGGGSQSDAICQITADIFGIPVSRSQTYETASLGTAVATMYFAGIFKTIEDASASMVRIRDTFVPNPENVKKYDYLYKGIYLELYPRLKKLYQRLKKFK